jgi:uncharacterized membrane protein YdjX (TVP38/TMEM64 family)
MRFSKLLKTPRFWLAIALVSALLLFCCTPLRVIFDQMFLEEQLQRWGHWAACLFVAIYTIATVFGIPGTVLTIAAGAVFGLIWGTILSVIGATLGAIGAFWVARYLLHDWAQHRFGHHKMLVKCKQAIADKPLAFILAVRFAPISPFNVVNFLFGLTPISGIDYAIGTFVGIIPGTMGYTWLGVTGKEALQGGDRLPFLLALGFLTLLSVLPVLARKSR